MMLDPIIMAGATHGKTGRERIDAFWQVESALIECMTDIPNLSTDDVLALSRTVEWLRLQRRILTIDLHGTEY